MDLILLLVAVFAVYRLALMITFEDGPFNLFKIVRREATLTEVDWVVEGFHCPLCVGFWLSFLFAIPFWDGPLTYLLYALGMAGAQTFLTMIGGVPSGDDN